ncbi:MAG: cupin domain-containing protein [Desulfobacteraceae bacterium]|jgi:quercetin dioxygenase-like cupin family protein
MAFWDLAALELEPFRPGIMSKAELGETLIMACMEIGAGLEDTGHTHPFDQCGIVLSGEIEMFIGEDRKRLRSDQVYFIPAGQSHGWKTFGEAVRVLDISLNFQPK